MVPNSVKIPVPFDYVFPNGALFLSVDKLIDFDRLKDDDNQARDEHGTPIWVVKVMDQDPDAGKFGRSTEVRVKIAATHQPVPPDGVSLPGGLVVRPVELTGLTVTPYVDNNPCKGINKPHRCRARLAWSYRATSMTTPGAASDLPAAA
ncbi:MAG TPA: hypothetical protein VFM55_04070 [Micromonosporaceae bacterium]|nr:hypothetical protein [Micromonosporaceae bacterium]